MSTILTPLYELTNYRRQLERLADAGEVPPEEIADTLEALEGDINEKAVQVAAFTRNLEATAQAVREAGKAMLARAERIEKRAEGVRNYLLFQMQANSITKIECPYFTLAVRKNPPSVVIDDEAQVPADYLVTPPAPPPRPDKVAIGRALKAGADVAGCRLTQSERLDIKE